MTARRTAGVSEGSAISSDNKPSRTTLTRNGAASSSDCGGQAAPPESLYKVGQNDGGSSKLNRSEYISAAVPVPDDWLHVYRALRAVTRPARRRVHHSWPPGCRQ